MSTRSDVACALEVVFVAILAAAMLFAAAGCIPDGDFGEMAPNPRRRDIVAAAKFLPDAEARELLVWHDNHDNVWDMRVHSLDTCPILTYSPAYKRHEDGDMTDAKWAKFLHGFFEEKHDEEGDCDCDEELADD